jgi:hypothetical protein
VEGKRMTRHEANLRTRAVLNLAAGTVFTAARDWFLNQAGWIACIESSQHTSSILKARRQEIQAARRGSVRAAAFHRIAEPAAALFLNGFAMSRLKRVADCRGRHVPAAHAGRTMSMGRNSLRFQAWPNGNLHAFQPYASR